MAEINQTLQIPTKHGEVSVEVRRPAGYAQVPIILTYSPHNILAEGRETQDTYGNRYVPQGYARTVADVIGTRNSQGCFDYGGLKEQQSGVDLVNGLAQPWSNGKVAMIKALPGEGAAFKRLFVFQGPHASPGPTTGRDQYFALLDVFFAKNALRGGHGHREGRPDHHPGPRGGGGRPAALRGGLPAAHDRADRPPVSVRRARRGRQAGRRALLHLTPTLFDVPPSGSPVPITRGFLDVRYRDGLEKAKPAPVNQPYRALVTFKPQDWTSARATA